MVLSKYSKDNFIAPKLSELTKVGAPELHYCTKEYGNWVGNFILNTIFRVRTNGQSRQLIMYFLRKVEGALQEYHEGRNFLENYVKNPDKSISSYFHSIRHFETSMALAYQAFGTIRTMIQHDLFTKEDGSSLQRMNRLQNLSKHANNDIFLGNIPGEFNINIWLTNDSIECHDTTLTFYEFSLLLKELANIAETMSNPPLHKPEKDKS
jgi:predicted DNA-binding protein YlxM (UPF0122 family)